MAEAGRSQLQRYRWPGVCAFSSHSTRVPPGMTDYDSLSGQEIASLPGLETMDGVSGHRR